MPRTIGVVRREGRVLVVGSAGHNGSLSPAFRRRGSCTRPRSALQRSALPATNSRPPASRPGLPVLGGV
jgi:hypothetical protein